MIFHLVDAAELFFWLVIGHAVGDFALQHHQFATGKNKNYDPPGYDPELHGPKQTVWPYYLTAHALVHAGIVGLITGSVIWAVYEFIVHWALDYSKTTKTTSIHWDQGLHISTKLLIAWATFIIATTP